MINLNLLPWREGLKQKHQRNFYILLAGIAFLAIAIVLIEYSIVSKASNQQLARNMFLQNHVDQLQAQIDKLKKAQEIQEPIMEQLNFFATLNNQRFQAVHFLNELPTIVPATVHLTKITYDGKRVDLYGEAQNNSEILLLVKKIAQSSSMSDPVLANIVSAKEEGQFGKNFEIILQFK